jgi:hypothetical protein
MISLPYLCYAYQNKETNTITFETASHIRECGSIALSKREHKESTLTLVLKAKKRINFPYI